MILIADSGSTKCIWAICDQHGNQLDEERTIGFNPNFISQKRILEELKKSSLLSIKNNVMKVFFYGAGCSSLQKNKIIQEPFDTFFSNADVHVGHDLDAACFAMYNGEANITCILGTGSNSCLYDGKKIYKNAPSLGFIVGDEASGNFFGKKIISLYFNKLLPENLIKIFEENYEYDINIINQKIYNNSRANVFLAEYFPFIIQTKNDKTIKKIIDKTLDEFINIHVKCFENYKNIQINFIGSVSYFLSKEIKKAAKRHKLKVGKIIQNPIKSLVNFHAKKIK
mgnify:CR=1 FL=1|tara:strand:+ start:5754 stop:6602 length:849 start_codon:yes stop_codon:yes gene_type:complete